MYDMLMFQLLPPFFPFPTPGTANRSVVLLRHRDLSLLRATLPPDRSKLVRVRSVVARGVALVKRRGGVHTCVRHVWLAT